jgi:hypothetical protein
MDLSPGRRDGRGWVAHPGFLHDACFHLVSPMTWLLLVAFMGVAHADDPPIQPVAPGESVIATVPSYLLPESAYDSCLSNTLALREHERALAEAVSEASSGLQATRAALTGCELQLEKDGVEIGELAVALDNAQRDSLRWKGQRNTALAVAAGALVTAATVMWVQQGEK